MQEMIVYRVGQYDREKFINTKIKLLNKKGWRVLSLSYPDESHVAFLAEKEVVAITAIDEEWI